jgi:hypothetical protein
VSGRTALVAAGLAVVLVAAAAAVALHAWYEREPPPLEAGGGGPGTALRLTPGSGSVPPPRFGVRLPDGTTTSVALAGIATEGGRAVGRVSVFPAAGQPSQLALREGETGRTDGVSVTVVRVWQMPDHANDAIDVRVIPAS